MAKVYLEDTTLTNIGNAIREKTGSTELLCPNEMPSAIKSIQSGGGTVPKDLIIKDCTGLFNNGVRADILNQLLPFCKPVNAQSMFFSYREKNLDIRALDFSETNNVYYCFSSFSTLVNNVKFGKNLGKGYTQKSNNYMYYGIDLSAASGLTSESLVDIINNLYDLNLTYDVANGGVLYTQNLRLGTNNLAKLSSEQIAIGTEKGWTIN